YDSAGVAVLDGGKLSVVRAVGKLQNLQKELATRPAPGAIGIGHTRWATHGKPSETNAHPHTSGRVTVVHNGIIENYAAIKERLQKEGRIFQSETDTEVISHLIDWRLAQGDDFPEAVRGALGELRGSYAVVALDREDPARLVAAKTSSPMVLGRGDGASFVASDIPAVLGRAEEFAFLLDGEMAVLDRGGFRVTTLAGDPVEKTFERIRWSPAMAEKGGYKHFMLKEIHEQPIALADTLAGRTSATTGSVYLEEFELSPKDLLRLQRVVLLGCGTTYHAALLGKHLIERIARLPAEVDLSSEFRYRSPVVDDGTLALCISQSGETADTLGALAEAKRLGCPTLAVTNVMGSSISRAADWTVYTHAGPEISVASTKAFTSQVALLYLMAVFLGRARGALDGKTARGLIQDVRAVPEQMTRILDRADEVHEIARRYMHAEHFLYLGRGLSFPVALEGALKLKELSYIHAEGYAGGEMKHGPIALIDESTPVAFVAPRDETFEKIASNMEEVRARGGRVLAVRTEGERDLDGKVSDSFFVPASAPPVAPLLTSLPLQLLAYHIADLRGTDVDQPRNLAKSVTVE
ncbi:MAG: glutamine--fructose-6-phosphate transaminase (isomerizing), partial [Candidatus Methylomirabilis sp.]|nr:glutamine--fructose-6-phosphate transaminase (isomerizing) [Deltaproteobacteria bacterium]